MLKCWKKRPFISVYLMDHIFQTSVLFNYVTIEYIEINWLCKHRKKIRSSQAYISINCCTKLSKTQLSLWVSLISILLFLRRKSCKIKILLTRRTTTCWSKGYDKFWSGGVGAFLDPKKYVTKIDKIPKFLCVTFCLITYYWQVLKALLPLLTFSFLIYYLPTFAAKVDSVYFFWFSV